MESCDTRAKAKSLIILAPTLVILADAGTHF